MSKKFVTGKETCKILGIHQRTLYQWDEKGWIETIRTPGNHRLYNVEKFLLEKQCKNDVNCINSLAELDNEVTKLNISYVRVSSHSQKDYLERQKLLISKKYPDHKMVVDIGSGIEFERPGFRKIINLAITGKINELVVAYKDRLTRFGFELIEDLIKDYSKGKIIIINKKDDLEPEEELVKDVFQIMNVYGSKMNGLRNNKKNARKD